MATKQQMERFETLKKLLVDDLGDIELEMDHLELVYNEKMTELGRRRDELRSLLFDENVKVTLDFTTTNEEPKALTAEEIYADVHGMLPAEKIAEMVRTKIQENPGISKKDLRKLLRNLTENQLNNALSKNREAGYIENRGTSKAQPRWFPTKKA